MNYRVELHCWNNQNGYTHSETFDNMNDFCTAEEYFNNCIDHNGNDLTPDNPDEAINIEIYDENNNLLSEYWLQKD